MELNKNFFNINTAKTIALSLGASTLIIGTPLAIGIGIVNNYAGKIDDASTKGNEKQSLLNKNFVQKKVSLSNKMMFLLDYLNDFRLEDESISKKMLFLNNKNEQFIYDAFFSSIHQNFGTYEENFKTLDQFTKFLNNDFIQKVDSKEFLKSQENKNKIFNQKILDKFIDSIKVDPSFSVSEFQTILVEGNNWEDLQQNLNNSLKLDFIISDDDSVAQKDAKKTNKKRMFKTLFQRKLIDSLLPKHFSNFNLDQKIAFSTFANGLFGKLWELFVNPETLTIKESIDDAKKDEAKTALEVWIDEFNDIKGAFDELVSKFDVVNQDSFARNIKKTVKNMYFKVNVKDIKEILKSKFTKEKTEGQIKALLGDLFLKNGLTKNTDVSEGTDDSYKSFSAFVIKNLFGITKKEFDGFNFKTYQNKIDSSFDEVGQLNDKTNIFIWESNDFVSSVEETKEKIKNLEILTFDSFKEFFVQDETLKKEYSKQSFNDLFLKTFTTESNSSFFNLNLKNISDLIYDSLYNNHFLGISVFEENDNKLETIFDKYVKVIGPTVLPKILEIIDQEKIDLLANEINKAILKFGLSEPIVNGSKAKIQEKILEVIETYEATTDEATTDEATTDETTTDETTTDETTTDETTKTYNLKKDFIKITNLLEGSEEVAELNSNNPLIIKIAEFFINKFNNPVVNEAKLINFLKIENENNEFFVKDSTGLNSLFFSKLLGKFNEIDVTTADAETKEKNFIDEAKIIFNSEPGASHFSKVENFAKKVYDFFKNDYKEIFIDNFINSKLEIDNETFSFFSQDAFDALVGDTTFDNEQKTKLINGVSILEIIKVFHTSKADVAKIDETKEDSEPEAVTPPASASDTVPDNEDNANAGSNEEGEGDSTDSGSTSPEEIANTENNQGSTSPEEIANTENNQGSTSPEEIANTENNPVPEPEAVSPVETASDAVSNNEEVEGDTTSSASAPTEESSDSGTPLGQGIKTIIDVSDLDIQAKKDAIKNIIVKIIPTLVDEDGAEIEDELNTKINDFTGVLYDHINDEHISYFEDTAKFHDQIIKTLDQDFFDQVDKIMNPKDTLFKRFESKEKILTLVFEKINWDQKITKVNSEFLSSLVQEIIDNYNGAEKIKVSSLPKKVYKIFNVQTKTKETLTKELKETLLKAVSGDIEEFDTVDKFSTWFFKKNENLNKFNFKKNSSIFNAFNEDVKNNFNKLFHNTQIDAVLNPNLFLANKKSPFSIIHNKWDKKNWNVEDIWSTFEESENKKAIDQENSNELDLLLNDLIVQYLNELEFYQITNVLDKLISNYFVEEQDLVNSGLTNEFINDLKDKNILIGEIEKKENEVIKLKTKADKTIADQIAFETRLNHVSELVSDNNLAISNLQTEDKTLDQSLRNLRRRARDNGNLIANLTARINILETDNDDSLISDLRSELNAEKSKIVDINRQLLAYATTAQLTEAKSKISAIETKLANYEDLATTAQLDDANDEITSAQSKIEDLESSLSTLTSTVGGLSTPTGFVTTADFDAEKQKITTANSEINSLRGNLEIAERTISELKDEISNLKLDQLFGSMVSKPQSGTLTSAGGINWTSFEQGDTIEDVTEYKINYKNGKSEIITGLDLKTKLINFSRTIPVVIDSADSVVKWAPQVETAKIISPNS